MRFKVLPSIIFGVSRNNWKLRLQHIAHVCLVTRWIRENKKRQIFTQLYKVMRKGRFQFHRLQWELVIVEHWPFLKEVKVGFWCPEEKYPNLSFPNQAIRPGLLLLNSAWWVSLLLQGVFRWHNSVSQLFILKEECCWVEFEADGSTGLMEQVPLASSCTVITLLRFWKK